MFRGLFFPLAGVVCFASVTTAQPLSKKTDLDFFRDVPSRNLKGLATRSDGRLVSGPTLTDIAGTAPADLLWCIERSGDPTKYLVGSGPDGKIFEVTLDSGGTSYATTEIAKLDDPQIFALKRLADGSILAGTSPKGALYLVRNGQPVARTQLPVDSLFDFVLLDEQTALVATGNPGRVYKIDLAKFSTAGLSAEKITDPAILATRGIVLFGEVRDRNVRRIVELPNGRIAAGSSPKGNIYTFAREGGAPVLLQENRDAEVTDLLPRPNGDLYATIVFSAAPVESRITPTGPRPAPNEVPPAVPVEKFGGRSSLVWFPANGFPETLASRSGVAIYRLADSGETLLLAGGEQGDLLGFDLRSRLSLTFAGSISSQLNGIVPFGPAGANGAPAKFLLLRNNAPGLALLDFNASGPREAETRRFDLGTPSLVGALRFNRLRNVTEGDLALDVKVSQGSDDVEGWSPWTPLAVSADSGWRAESLRGRYGRLRLRVLNTTSVGAVEIDRGNLFALPQNRRPQLQDFRVLTPNFGVIPAADQPPSANVSLSQLMQNPVRDDEGKRKGNFLSSQVVPSPGAQVVLWTVTDPDTDNFRCTFSIRRDGDTAWTDLAVNTPEGYVQFDTASLPDGVYFTRLIATETAPRPVPDRLSHTFETDDLIVDRTAPEVVAASARRAGDSVLVTMQGRDKLSLLDGVEFVFNNGVRETVEQPADGIRDGREETFTFEIPFARISNATSVEVTLYDAAGNGTARRLTW